VASFDDRSVGSSRGPDWSRINQWLLWIGLAAAVGWLFFRHGEHLSRLFPFLILLACPLMHVFGHRHGGHDGHRNKGDERPRHGDSPPGDDSRRHVH
jgi:hypothetical protein